MRSVVGFILIVLIACPAYGAGPEGFVRLPDGTIAKVTFKSPEQVTFRKADGSAGQIGADEIDGWLSSQQADKLVDLILPKTGIKAKHGEVRKQLAALQMAAVPRIIHHLKTGDELRRLEAISALQFVWYTDAEAAVNEALDDKNDSVRSIALQLIRKRVPGDHTKLIDNATDDENPAIAGSALYQILVAKPDAERLYEVLLKKELWPYLHSLLPRYHDRVKFGKIAHSLLDSGTSEERGSAICALIHQYDLDLETQTEIVKLLGDREASIRMRAAEYLRWHGVESLLPALRKALDAENDLHCRATIRASITAIERRQKIFASLGNTTAHKWDDDFDAASRTALKDWNTIPPTAAMRLATLKLLGTRGSAPFIQYGGRNDADPNDTDGRYLELINLVTGYPSPAKRQGTDLDQTAISPPTAKTLVPPVRNYFDSKRESFGLFTGEDAGPFSDSHHIGDDVAFRQQHETVVAIGDGVIRHAVVASPSWGGIVVIEHIDPKTGKPFCSLYSHLGPLICVETGDMVHKGDMLVSLGRDFTRATGGYMTHLHFGIHLSPFEGRWICGYLSPERFNGHDHSWIDPQPFIKARMK